MDDDQSHTRKMIARAVKNTARIVKPKFEDAGHVIPSLGIDCLIDRAPRGLPRAMSEAVPIIKF